MSRRESGGGPPGAPPAGWLAALRRRAFKPVYLLHYRLLYGRRFPGAAWLEGRVRAWERATGRGDAPAPKARWEDQYAGGHWEVMRGADELARYSVIAGWLHRLHPGGRVLDVGCGEGILLEHLAPLGFTGYTGVDLSEVAVGRARARFGAAAAFHAADAERWEPAGGAGAGGDGPERWDAVVLNECVYYFEQPVASVLRYRRWLTAGGSFVISTFRSRRADVIRRRLAAVLPPVEELAISGRKGTWVIGIYRP